MSEHSVILRDVKPITLRLNAYVSYNVCEGKQTNYMSDKLQHC